MMRFLRYNSRHQLWFPQGYQGRWLPQLNPISSVYDRKFRPRFHEPRWLYQLRLRLFAFAGRQRCGRRGENPMISGRFGGDKPLPDTWDMGPDGNRTCSYCGSIHPDDLMEICRKTIVDERYGVESTTKSYKVYVRQHKVYVRQPGVRNASEGAIKFYMHHAPEKPSAADQQLFKNALRATAERFEAEWQKRYPTPQRKTPSETTTP